MFSLDCGIHCRFHLWVPEPTPLHQVQRLSSKLAATGRLEKDTIPCQSQSAKCTPGDNASGIYVDNAMYICENCENTVIFSSTLV
jgi:hypothetical protein